MQCADLCNCRFNRGSLINVGFLLTESAFDYIAIHDVDLIPENENITYHYPELGPYHVSAPGLHPKYHYEKFLGGILLINREDFRMVGMPTLYLDIFISRNIFCVAFFFRSPFCQLSARYFRCPIGCCCILL